MVKNLPANAGTARDVDLIPGLGRSPGGGNDNHSSILVGIIPWQEKPGGLYSPWGCKESDTAETTEHIHISILFQILLPRRSLQSIK